MTGERPRREASRSLVRPILIGLTAGVITGLTLGDYARVFAPFADGFVKLLQMAVLPYVTVSIVASIGSLRPEDMRTLGVKAAAVLLTLWAVALLFAFLMPLTFPPTQGATFFSTTLLERPASFDLVDLYIPSNPFFALANNIVPAVVLFSMLVGIALIGLPRRQVLLDVLNVVSQGLAQVMRFSVRLTPYGVFAIAATTAGTLRLEQVGKLQVYLIAYPAIALLLGLWVLPGLVAALTPIPARAILSSTREALITGVVAGDLFIVLPVLITACKDLIAQYVDDTPAAEAAADLIVPVSYNFPHAGKILSVSFVLFAGWFSNASIDPLDYPKLGLTAIVTLFGSMNSAMPFLLDLLRIPADTFQLFLASGVINSRFGTLVAAMHTVTMALLGTCAVAGAVRLRPRALVRYAAITATVTIAIVGGTRLAAGRMLGQQQAAADALSTMHLDRRGEAAVLQASAPVYRSDPGTRLAAIRARQTLRVGYLSDALPFAFFNGQGDLVGLDIALMHRLAMELDVRVEFVPVGRNDADGRSFAAERLRSGYCDILVGGFGVTTRRAEVMQLSTPYLDETVAFVVRDADRRRFETWDSIREIEGLTIAMPNVPYYIDMLHARLPRARLQTVTTIDSLFGSNELRADAIALPAERGSAWTLRYPQYAVVIPTPGLVKIPLAYATPPGEPELSSFLNTWLELKRRDGTVEDLYQYWILGRDAVASGPRWSIIRNVLGWVD